MSAPQTFRKKPVEIEAMQWDGSAAGATPIIGWLLAGDTTARYNDPQPATMVRGKVVREAVPALLSIDTLEGVMRATPGDWIIRGVQGEFYPCKPDIFEATYERVPKFASGGVVQGGGHVAVDFGPRYPAGAVDVQGSSSPS